MIPVTPTTTFTYDAIGNRIRMTDGYGYVDYEYNSISQIISETRKFTDSLQNAPLSNNRFKLEYSYNLAGRLKSIKDPYGDEISYTHDKSGRLDTITGTIFGDVTDYVTSSEYRAWNAPREINYGNGSEMEATFNHRLQAENFHLTKTNTSTTLVKKQYEFWADGALKYVKDFQNPKFDRLFKYDFNTRLTETRTGAEAREEAVPNDSQIVYRQNYSYSTFGQLASRTGDWKPGLSCEDPDFSFSYNFQNNRNTGLGYTYDADGRNTHGKGIHSIYDASGQTVRTYNGEGDYDVELFFDGNGKEIKRKTKSWDYDNNQWKDPIISYYIRSTVVGGAIISDVKDDGQKKQTYVYASGEKLAVQSNAEGSQPDSVVWEIWDAAKSSSYSLDKTGSSAYGISGGNHLELDPLGVNVNYPCLPSLPRGYRVMSFSPFQRHSGYQPGDEGIASECYWDGIPTSCSTVRRGIGHGREAVGDIRFFDDLLPVFSDLTGRMELDNLMQMQPPGDSTNIYVTHWEDDGSFVTETDVTAGTTNYNIDNQNSTNYDDPPCKNFAECLALEIKKNAQCDAKLARIFGDKDTFVATVAEPGSVSGKPDGLGRGRLGTAGEDPTKGVVHIFSNINGSPQSGTPGFVGNLFTPKGGTINPKADPVKSGKKVYTYYSNIQVTYKRGALSNYGFQDGLVISFVHAGPVNNANRVPSPITNSTITNDAGSVLIGTIGADGSKYDGGGGGGKSYLDLSDVNGDGVTEFPLPNKSYIHVHAIFYKVNKKGKRFFVDPRSVFCKDLGF